MSQAPDPRVIDPTRPRGPGVHYQEGPPVPIPAEQWWAYIDDLGRHIESLAQAVRAPKRRLPVDAVAFGNTNSSGNVTFPVYQVGAGFYFHLERLTVEAATFDATSARTPAAPYSNASFWLGMFISPNPLAVSQGGMFDFLPTTAGAQGLPDTADYEPAVTVRSQDYIVCDVHVGPASQRISVHFQGWLEGQEA
jgi:hypothetical protein